MAGPSRRSVMAGAAALGAAAFGPARAAPLVGDMSLGDPEAKVKVIEYASLTCGHCAHFNAAIFPAFSAKYVDTGRVHYTLREFLTPPAHVAAAGFLMARGAGRGKYFNVVDAIFRSQPRWPVEPVRSVFLEIAKAHGLSEAEFEACIDDGAAVRALNERVRRGAVEYEVSSTPTFVINGRKVKEGVMSLAELDAAIAAAAG